MSCALMIYSVYIKYNYLSLIITFTSGALCCTTTNFRSSFLYTAKEGIHVKVTFWCNNFSLHTDLMFSLTQFTWILTSRLRKQILIHLNAYHMGTVYIQSGNILWTRFSLVTMLTSYSLKKGGKCTHLYAPTCLLLLLNHISQS